MTKLFLVEDNKMNGDLLSRRIALTARALVSDRMKAFEVGCDVYDPKPIEFGRASEKSINLLVVRKTS